MSKLGAVIWDMDGVLVDTAEFHYQSWHETLADVGITYDRDTFRHTFGKNNETILREVMGNRYNPAEALDIGDSKEARFRELIRGQATLLPGVRELLEALQAAGIPQAIGSSAPMANIEALAGALGLEPFFGAMVSAAEMPGKPDPAVFLEAAKRLNVEPARCVVVEDAIAGVEAAHRAGMRCTAVTNTHPAGALAAAELVVDSLSEVTLARLEALFSS